MPARPEPWDDGVAIVGVAGRFPGAPDVQTYWANLCAGVESLTVLDEDRLEDAFDAQTRSSKNFVRARGLLPDVERFDAAFFGMQAREAELTDPQHRILLETCWEALEDAGYDPAASAGTFGIVAGCSINTYFLRHVLRDRATVETFASDYQVGSFPLLVGGGHDFLATRIAYKLDLRGPAMTVASACSTSLLAVAQAAQALRCGQADVMLAGAASISFPQYRGYVYQDGGMVSSDGHCRTFDAAASGTVFGAGAGVVVLKRLADARADNDSVYAVIRGIGITNDGAAKVGYAAPSVAGQAAAIEAAHRSAGFDPITIDYVECHGTATPLGDPIEVAALTKAFARAGGATRCALGSVKPNVGHLDAAAGMAGLIKTALAIRHAKIPATLHYTAPNPRIDFAATPFYVNAQLADWPGEGASRRAGVSAFGVGGTNVHVVLEAEPARARHLLPGQAHVLTLSARSDVALGDMASRLATHLRTNPAVEPADVAFTLQRGRRHFGRRRAFVAASSAEAVAKLEAFATADSRTGVAAVPDAGVAFLFPGQGAQFVGMGRGLYADNAVFRAALDECAEIVRAPLGADLRTLLYPERPDEAATRALTATAVAQPAIFSVSYALARLWASWDIAPVAMLGHSIGEFVAATLASVFSLEDALRLVTARGRLMADLPSGGMLAVGLAEADVAPLLLPALGIAAVNSPRQTVVAGPHDALAAFQATLAARDVTCKRVATSHAFHSPMMEPLRAPLFELLSTMRLSAPTRPYVSSVTGRWIDDADATSPAYWADHARATVRFADALATLVEAGPAALLEVGPGTALSAAARQGAGRTAGCAIVSSLPGIVPGGEREELLAAAGALWEIGAQPAWTAGGNIGGRRISLPAYPFERRRHWLDLPGADAALETNDVPEVQTQASPERELAEMLEQLSGERIDPREAGATFLELGFDSLFLGRFVQKVNARYGLEVTFRQLLGDLPSLAALARHIVAVAPPAAVSEVPSAAPLASVASLAADAAAPASTYEAVVREQLQAMQQLMREQLAAVARAVPKAPASLMPTTPPATRADEGASRFDAFRITAAAQSDISAEQRAHIDALVARVTARTPKSKAYTQRYRKVLADPRVAAGFRAEWKEMVYPIVCERATGARLWDLDGNEYIDVLNGFGQTAFGHAPEFVVAAVAAQLQRGFAIGPQTELAGEVAELFCKLTGNERVTFCNTGSEAVMAALRIARTVTGRDRIVIFGGAYHGQFDEVLVKGARTSHRSIPIAPGIPAEAVANVTVLPYGAPESLAYLREHAADLAAVVVEPVQSRHPALAPTAFLHEVRALTEATGTALVFDEVVTGFRMHPGGLQTAFGIHADLATYGKVVGGGMPIGILAGRARFMDALDGGMWQYGDASEPEVPPTFFAGTFVRHPLALAAVLAVLRHLDAEGPALQAALTARTERLVARLNDDLAARGWPGRIETFGSLFHFNFAPDERLAGLLYYHLRARGIYIQEGFPCFLTTAHTDADLDAIVRAFGESFDALQAAGIFRDAANPAATLDVSKCDVPLTEAQNEIWLAAQVGDEASCAFNESLTLRLTGKLNEAALASAFEGVVARHEALRASYGTTGETMRIDPHLKLSYDTLDISGSGPAAAQASLDEFIARDARTPFDLTNGPVVRARLFRLAADVHAFVFTAHHIACDGWSINVILEELGALYAEACTGVASGLRPPLPFTDYARRLRERAPLERAKVEAYWHEQFAAPVQPLDLPTDRPRPARKTFNGATRSMRIDERRYFAIKKAGVRNGCTLFVSLLAAFSALLGRLGSRTDVVVGIPAAGQASVENEILVGHCVDFLPIRAGWDAQTRFSELLGEVKRRVLDAYEHQDYTLGTLVRTLGPARESNRLPLTEVQFNLERLGDRVAFPGLAADVVPNPKAFVIFDVFFNIIEGSDGLRIDCDYNADLFDTMTIGRWLQYFRTMLDSIAGDASVLVEAAVYAPPLEIASDERVSLSAGPVRALDAATTVSTLFERQVAARPAAVAAASGDARITYAELDRRANRLARHLLARTGGPGQLVGVSLDRSLDLLVALLAVHKAGCAYVPLDPTHPAARLRYILAEARVAALIVDGSADPSVAPAGTPVISLELDAAAISAEAATAPDVNRDARDLAYVIYTSGSTGAPKGVEIEHRSVVNLLEAVTQRPGIGPDDVLLAVTTVSFDIAALELFAPLVAGGTVAIATADELADGFRLLRRLGESRATVVQATPALWRILLEAGFRSTPGTKMLCGGEALREDVARRLLEGDGELWNMYGPTETTIWSSWSRITAGSRVTAGAPIDNTQFYVLDENDRPVALGASGHLHIAGAGLARGYVARPELTAEKFVANPFGTGRLYRTGDAVRMHEGGDVDILGRIDQQVKVRGFRVELGEIEAVLAQAPELVASAVALREDAPGDARLVAYFVDRREAPAAPAALQARLAERLPDYMVPATWVRLDGLPLSGNGKLDRAALPAPAANTAPNPDFIAPRTPVEIALAKVWAEVLHLERVGVGDDLFALGADSIHLFQITARANKQGVPLAAKQLFAHRTIAEIVRHLEPARPATASTLTVLPRPVAPRDAGQEQRPGSRRSQGCP
jgi:amino acid adenylation domain-containing protein